MTAVDWSAGEKVTAEKLLAMEVGHLVLPSAATNINTTTTETVFAQILIPANVAEVGMCFRIKAWGAMAVTGTPTITVRLRVGNSATPTSNTQVAQTTALTVQSGVTNRLFIADTFMCCESIGAAGALNGPLKYKTSGILAGTAPYINDAAEITTVIDGTASATVDTTAAATYIQLTAQWSASSASNIFLCKGVISEKLVG